MRGEGQITIPPEVRRKLRIKTGDRVRFVEGENGEFMVRPADKSAKPQAKLVPKPKTGSIMDLCGIVHWDGPPAKIEEMNQTISTGWAGLLTFDDE